MEATPHGSSSNEAKSSSTGRPSSDATIACASPGANGVGTASCVLFIHSMYSGGTKSPGVVLMNCAFLR